MGGARQVPRCDASQRRRTRWGLVALAAAVALLAAGPAYAYIDPGTTSTIFGSIGPILMMLLAALGMLLWPIRWMLMRFFHWAKDKPALAAVGRAVSRVFRPVGRFLWRVLWPVRRPASALGHAARAHPRRAFLAGGAAVLAGGAVGAWWALAPGKLPARRRQGTGANRRVIVLGIDGLDPDILESLLRAGGLPHFRRLSERGGLARLATSVPAHSPNAWTCLATGCDAGQHGVFDFIKRNPENYRLDLSIVRPNPSNPLGRRERMFLPVRRCPAFWEAISEAGIPATVVRWPVTFAPDALTGRMLSGLGVPDIKGGLGAYTFYTTAAPGAQEEGRERVVVVAPKGNVAETAITGPEVAGVAGRRASRVPLRIELHPDANRVTLAIGGERRQLAAGQWSEYVHLRFDTGAWSSVSGMAQFYLKEARPCLQLYLSPIEVDPTNPAFPITGPGEYATELAGAIGAYHTLGMPEDTKALTEGRIGADAFLHLCEQVNAERERMLLHELGRFEDGLLALVADTSDRLQHMFWTTRDTGHPFYDAGFAQRYAHVIPDVYRHSDRLLGHVLERAGDDTAVIVVSDHGFGSFRRAVHLNSWLADQGFLMLSERASDSEGGALFQNVMWEQTSAYALGFAGIYVNLRGREGSGVIAQGQEYRAVCDRMADGLRELRDPQTGERPVRRVYFRDEVYHGPLVGEAPDLVLGFERGYRASWQTAIGGAPKGLIEDNRKLWSGDHIVDPHYVPGVIALNRPFRHEGIGQADLAPTVLKIFGLQPDPPMGGESLL